MTTIGLDFVVIKDHRGFKSGFFWSDVQQVIGNYSRAAEVKVKFRNDHEGTYTLIFGMFLDEFLAEVAEQLNYPHRSSLDGDTFPPPPAAEFFEPRATYLFKEDDK